jgi:hypothetical protein
MEQKDSHLHQRDSAKIIFGYRGFVQNGKDGCSNEEHAIE